MANLIQRKICKFIRQLLRQGLVQNHAKRINIRAGGQRFSAPLLGTCVHGCQRPHFAWHVLRAVLFLYIPINNFSNAKVQQFWNAFSGHHNIVWLQIAVNNADSVRVCDCGTHLTKNGKALGHGQFLALAPQAQGQAFYKLHDEVRAAVLCHTTAIQPRNAGMI